MFTKVAIVLCAVFAAAQATAIMARPIESTGVSTSTRTQDSLGNYAFAYDIVDEKGASNSRSEVGDAFGNKKGSYFLSDIDGRARKVNYVADEDGFRATVKTNEPGTALSAPADVEIISPYAPPAAPVADAPVEVAPVAPVIATPVVHTAKFITPAIPVPVAAFIGHPVIGHPAAIPVPLGFRIYKAGFGKSLFL